MLPTHEQTGALQAPGAGNKRSFEDSFPHSMAAPNNNATRQPTWAGYSSFGGLDEHIPSFGDVMDNLNQKQSAVSSVDSASSPASLPSPVTSDYVPDPQQQATTTTRSFPELGELATHYHQAVSDADKDHLPHNNTANCQTNQEDRQQYEQHYQQEQYELQQQQQQPQVVPDNQQSLGRHVETRRLGLRVVGPMESLWYADRPFPRFNIAVVDLARPDKPLTSLSNWKLSMRVIDGHGEDASGKIYSQVLNHAYPVQKGVAPIAGLRFKAVSSKSGGHFKVLIDVISPSAVRGTVDPFVSGKIQVLSYRLYHAQKVPFKDLKASDNIAKMKGIGTLYAKRFASLGFKSVADLASLEVELLSAQEKAALLAALRKDRGAMTLPKLAEYVQQARDILARCSRGQPRAERHAVLSARQQHHPEQHEYQQQQQLQPQHEHYDRQQQQHEQYHIQQVGEQQHVQVVEQYQQEQQQQPPSKRARLSDLAPNKSQGMGALDIAHFAVSELHEVLRTPLAQQPHSQHALPSFLPGFGTV